jgi:chromosome segregation ATPase
MALQAKVQAKQATLAESVTRANEATVHFNELSSRHQRLQTQFSDLERDLADARRQTSLSRDVARRKDAEYQTHTALMAQLTDD